MDISKDLCSIRVEREETDMLRGISAQDLKKAEDHINLKVDSCLNQLKSVIDELYNDIKTQLYSDKNNDIGKYSHEIGVIEDKIHEKWAVIDKLRG